MIKLENVSKIYKGEHRRPPRRHRRHRQGRVRLPGRALRLGQVDLPPPRSPRRRSRTRGSICVAGKDIGALTPLEGPVPAPQHRLRLPGLQAPPQQDGLRERRLRPRGDRPAPARRHRPRCPQILDLVGLAKKTENLPDRALRRRAAAGVDRPGVRQPAADPPGRRAHRQPRPDHLGRHHAPARPHQPHRHHRRHGHPRPGHRRHDAPPGDRARPRHRSSATRPAASTASGPDRTGWIRRTSAPVRTSTGAGSSS